MSPDEGPPGTLVSITGTGFAASTLYRVYFDSDGDERWDSGEPYRTVRTDAVGKFTTILTIPTVLSGEYYIRADVSPYTPPAVASARFTVKTVYEKLINIEALIADIQEDLDTLLKTLPRWGDIVTRSLSEVASTVASAVWGHTKAQTVETLLSGIKADVDTIEGKVFKLPEEWPAKWGDIVTKSWGDLTSSLNDLETNIQSAIASAKGEILSEIKNVEGKLGTFSGGDTVASLLYRILEKKSFIGGFSGTYSWDPTFDLTKGRFIAVNPVDGNGSGKINDEDIGFSIKGYLRSNWGHALAFWEKFRDDCALVDGWLNITVTDEGEIFVRVDGIQCETGVPNINVLTGTFEIIAGTGMYAGAEGSGEIKATINTANRSFIGSFDGKIK